MLKNVPKKLISPSGGPNSKLWMTQSGPTTFRYPLVADLIEIDQWVALWWSKQQNIDDPERTKQLID